MPFIDSTGKISYPPIHPLPQSVVDDWLKSKGWTQGATPSGDYQSTTSGGRNWFMPMSQWLSTSSYKGLDLSGTSVNPPPAQPPAGPGALPPPITGRADQSTREPDIFTQPIQTMPGSNLLNFAPLAMPRITGNAGFNNSQVPTAPMSNNWTGINSLNWWQR